MSDDITPMSGPELIAYAKKSIPRHILKQSLNEQAMRDFIRIVLLFSYSAMGKPDAKQWFKHTFAITNKNTGKITQVNFDVKVTTGPVAMNDGG